MIELRNFSKSYGSREILHGVNFTAPPRSVTALAGLNGAGKTTILKAVCSIHYADGGSVSVNGIDAEASSVKNKAQTGFMSEHADFSLPFTVYELLHFHAAAVLAESPAKAQKDAVFFAAESCGLCDVFSQKVKDLSNGLKRRLSLACCLLKNPSVLVLDEPEAGLDPRQTADMRSLITELSKTKTVLFSTHLISEIENLCSKIIILHNGTVAADGTKEALCAQTGSTRLEDAFLRITEHDKRNP